MKTIGFIDYFLNEWHANEYPGMIRAYNEKHGTDYQVKYAWAEMDIPGGMSTDEWCEKYGVTRCYSIEELCEKCDYVIVLSPSNPEKHFSYAEKVFACGKSPYIDKTFAPDYTTAKAIFDLAKQYGVSFFSTSALRYSEELTSYMGTAKAIFTVGGGSNMEEYIIHQIEMAVKCLGVGAEKVRYAKHADQEWAEVAYADGRHATMMFARCMPFAATVSEAECRAVYHPINSPFFDHLIADILHFFETGETSFCSCETLEVMKIREAVIKAKACDDEWVIL
jgi:hypothetical protein